MNRSGVMLSCGAVLATAASVWGAGINNTLFLNHFDAPIGEGAGPADYANGDPAEQITRPFGPGGMVVSSPAQFAGSLFRFNGSDVGGRVEYNTAGNFDLQRGTIEMWINSSTLTSPGFVSFFGTEVPSSAAPGDIRFYLYDTGGGRTLGAYMASPGGFWECEQPVPVPLLTNDQWHHIAWTWDLAAKTTATFWDGQTLRNTPDSGTVGFNGAFTRTLFHIGESQFGSASFPGYMDEFRISDVVRYTGNFTPPTQPFSVAIEWNLDSSGSWSVAGNWTGGVPNSVGATANFGSIITAPRVVTVDAPMTVGSINFDNANSYTLAGTSTLTLDASVATAINLVNGSHAISVPMVVQKDLTVTVANALNTLTVSNDVSAASAIITKAGAGKLAAKNVRALALSVNAGTIQVTANGTANRPSGTSRVFALAIASGAQLDLTNNSMVIDYTTIETLLDDVRQDLQSGRLTTSASTGATRLGYGDNSVLGLTTFAGQTVGPSSVLIKYTWAGDANLDGQVDISDLGSLATSWQTSSLWTGGDFDYSGFVDISDLGILATNWQQGVGSPLGPSFEQALASVGLAGVSVPEPSLTGALICASVAAARIRRRRKS